MKAKNQKDLSVTFDQNLWSLIILNSCEIKQLYIWHCLILNKKSMKFCLPSIFSYTCKPKGLCKGLCWLRDRFKSARIQSICIWMFQLIKYLVLDFDVPLILLQVPSKIPTWPLPNFMWVVLLYIACMRAMDLLVTFEAKKIQWKRFHQLIGLPILIIESLLHHAGSKAREGTYCLEWSL